MDSVTLKDVVSFVITADEEVEQDFITITFQAIETGNDPNKVQADLAVQLKLALDIARPKKAAGEVNITTGNFQISPSYNKKGEISGYHGSVQLIASGTDTKTVAGLTSEIKSMAVSDIQHSVSPALQKSVEEKLAIRAIALWREKAATYATAFGALNSGLINADVRIDNGNHYRPRGRMMAMAASAEMGGGAIEQESGKETLTATVSGTIQLFR